MEKEKLFNLLDVATKNHSIRVAELSMEIAKRMGIKDYQSIYEIAKFHDIGKLKIDSKILFKPDRLTDEEFDIIKTHPKLGVEIMSDYFDKNDLNVILYHHENVDGSGYYQKTVKDIPLFSKIIRIADVYDALISSRCYKDAYSKEDALFIMNHNVGKQFDRKIFSEFLMIVLND